MGSSSQSIGTVLMAFSAIQMLVFTIAIMRRSYLAIALPVFAAVTMISGVLFWIGYTMVSMEPDLDTLDTEDEEEPPFA
jgi:hypothetical protein